MRDQLVFPVAGGVVELHDERGLGAGCPAASVAGPGLPPGLVVPSASVQGCGAGSRCRRGPEDGRGLVAGLEARHVDRFAVGTDGERAGRIGEEAHDAQRRATQRIAEVWAGSNTQTSARGTPARSELRIARAGHIRDAKDRCAAGRDARW